MFIATNYRNENEQKTVKKNKRSTNWYTQKVL